MFLLCNYKQFSDLQFNISGNNLKIYIYLKHLNLFIILELENPAVI